MPKSIYVINSMGEKEPFSFKKVYRSARNSGAPKSLAISVAETVAKEVYPANEAIKYSGCIGVELLGWNYSSCRNGDLW